MTDDSPVSPAPAAFNGHSTSAQQTAEATRQTAQAAQQIAGLVAGLGQMLTQVARLIPSQHLCAQCVSSRLAWEGAHQDAIMRAAAAAREAAGLPEGGQADPVPFLPEQLRPGGADGIPPLRGAVTTAAGSECCAEHVPGRPGQRGRQLLIATGSLSPSAMAQFGRP